MRQPCVAVYGSTVPQTFWKALQSGNVGDGSLARFLVFQSQCNFPDEQDPEPVARRLPAVVDDLRAIAAGAADGSSQPLRMAACADPEPWTVLATSAAKQADRALRDEHLTMKRKHEGTPFAAIVARFREHVRRVALIAAVADDPAAPALEERHLAWAASLVRWTQALVVQHAERYVADNPYEAEQKKLLEVIRRHGGWMDGRTLVQRTRFIPKKMRNELISALLEAGDIVTKQESTATKTRTLIRAT